MCQHRPRRFVAALASAMVTIACAGTAAHPESECRSAEQARAARCYAVERTPAVTQLIEESERAKAQSEVLEAQKRRAEAERKRIEAARRREAERALQEQIARETQQLEEGRRALLDGGRIEYIAQIKDKIERNWSYPARVPRGLKCVVRISQIPGGEIVQVEIRPSSGNRAFDRSVEEAIWRSSPLPVPRDRSLFDRNIVITFEPEA